MGNYLTRNCECTEQSVMGRKRPKVCQHGNRFQTEAELTSPPRSPLARLSEKRQVEDQRAGKRRRSTLKQGRGFAASPEQRAKVKGLVCIGCGREASDYLAIDPAHFWPKGKGGCDSPDCVGPLCREASGEGCHRLFDEGKLDLLPALISRGYFAEMGHMITAHELSFTVALERVTGQRWAPADRRQRDEEIRADERARVEGRQRSHGEFLEDFLDRVTEWTGSDEGELTEAKESLLEMLAALNPEPDQVELERLAASGPDPVTPERFEQAKKLVDQHWDADQVEEGLHPVSGSPTKGGPRYPSPDPDCQPPDADGEDDWRFFVHEGGEYVSINDGKSGDTLLRIGGQSGSPGYHDLAKVRAFADYFASLPAPKGATE